MSAAFAGDMRPPVPVHEALEARQYEHLCAIDEAYFHTFRAMRHVAGEDDSHPSLLSTGVSSCVSLRRELLKQSLLAQHEKKANTGGYSTRNRLALGECGGLEEPVKTASPVEPLPTHERVKGGYAAWRRALLGLRLEKRRHAVEDDMIRRLASEAMQRAMAAEQSERERELALSSGSSFVSGGSNGSANKPDPMVWRVKQDFTQVIARAVASAAAAEGASGRQGGNSSPMVTITAVAFTYSAPDVFAVGTDNGLICLCSAQTGHVWATLRGHSGSAVTNLDWSEGYRETLLASCSSDRSVKLWRVTFPSRKAPPSLPADLLQVSQQQNARRGRQEGGQQQAGGSSSRSVPPGSVSTAGGSAAPTRRATSIAAPGRVKPESKPKAKMTAEERARELDSLRKQLQDDLRRERILREQAKGIVLIGGSAECIRTIYTPWPLTHVKFVPQKPGFLVAAGVEDEGGDDAADNDNNSDNDEEEDDATPQQQQQQGGGEGDEEDDQVGALEPSAGGAGGGTGLGAGRVASLRRRSSSANSANNPLGSPVAPGRAGVLGVRAAASLITRGMKGSVKAMKAVGGATMGALEAVPVVGGAMAGTVGMTANLVKGATNLTVGAAVGTLGVLGVNIKRKGGKGRKGGRGRRGVGGGNRIGHLMVLQASAPPDRSTLLQDLKVSGFYSSSSLLSSAGAAALALARGNIPGTSGSNSKNAVSFATALTFDYLPGGGSQGQGGNVLYVSDARGRVHAYQIESDPSRYSYTATNYGGGGGSSAAPALLKDHCLIWGEGSTYGGVFQPIGVLQNSNSSSSDIWGPTGEGAAGGGGGGSGASTTSGGGGNSSANPGAAGDKEIPFLVSLSYRQQLVPITTSSDGYGGGTLGSPAMTMTSMLVGIDSTNHVRALKLAPPINPDDPVHHQQHEGGGGGGGGGLGSSMMLMGYAGVVVGGHHHPSSMPGYGWAPASVSEVTTPPFLVYTQQQQASAYNDGGELPTGNHCSIAVSSTNPSLYVGTPVGEVFILDPYGQQQQQHQLSSTASSTSSLGLLKGGNPAAIGAGILSSQVVAKLFGLGLHPPLAAIQHVSLSRFEDWLVSCDELGGLYSWEKVPLSVATGEGYTSEDAGYVCEEEAWPSAGSSSSNTNAIVPASSLGSPTSSASSPSLLSSASSLGLRGAGLGVGVAAIGSSSATSTSEGGAGGLAGAARIGRLQKQSLLGLLLRLLQLDGGEKDKASKRDGETKKRRRMNIF
jgi:hypothetical protein